MKNTRQRLLDIFENLLTAFGPRGWWPGETQLEVIIGAVLTQNTTWKNVEKAIKNLKEEGLLDLKKLYRIDAKRLSNIIKPSGYYNIKSNRLKNIVKVLYEYYNASISNLEAIDTDTLRRILLGINGIGKETADSILLYALNRPVFVVDAYTKRFFANHRPPLISDGQDKTYKGYNSYDRIQSFFMDNLPLDTYLFNEYHALIVHLCQIYCKKKPLCSNCPVKDM